MKRYAKLCAKKCGKWGEMPLNMGENAGGKFTALLLKADNNVR